MRPIIVIFGGVALSFAVGAGLLLNNMTSPSAPTVDTVVVPPKPKTIGILVASGPLEAGKILNSDNLEWQEWPEGSVQKDQGIALASNENERPEVLKNYTGTTLRIPMIRGEPFNDDKVIRPGTGSVLALVLSPGMRSMTISVDAVSGAAGMAQPGDKVDIMLTSDLLDSNLGTVDPKTGRARPRIMTETILKDIKIIASDRRLNPNLAVDAPIAQNITLELTPEQAEIIATGSRLGRFSLSVRSFKQGPDPVRVGLPITTDVAVTPKLQAARRGIPFDKIDPKENPFTVEKADPVTGLPRSQNTITIYRYNDKQTVVINNNGQPATSATSDVIAPGGVVIPAGRVFPNVPEVQGGTSNMNRNPEDRTIGGMATTKEESGSAIPNREGIK
jgi:pilus assembly protein CpaB